MYEEANGNTMLAGGTPRTKKRHDLYGIDPDIFSAAIHKLVKVLRSVAGEVSEARLIPEREAWGFYAPNGECVAVLPHSIVDQTWEIMTREGRSKSVLPWREGDVD